MFKTLGKNLGKFKILPEHISHSMAPRQCFLHRSVLGQILCSWSVVSVICAATVPT